MRHRPAIYSCTWDKSGAITDQVKCNMPTVYRHKVMEDDVWRQLMNGFLKPCLDAQVMLRRGMRQNIRKGLDAK
jgi:hypothetical protein